LTAAFLDEMGNFENEEELRKAIRENLERRLKYEQQQRARQQVLASLTVAADWELPPSLLKRQAKRELERSILELRRSGFSDDEIRAHINELQQNSAKSTAKALKEHFILERLAEEEKIEDSTEDYETEIELIAAQSGESARRVRAQLEKRELMDTLRNQIIERKAIELILGSAKFKDVPYQIETAEAEALDEDAGGPSETATSTVETP
jgi:trigger factor